LSLWNEMAACPARSWLECLNLAPVNNIIGGSHRGFDPVVPTPCTHVCSQGSAVTPHPRTQRDSNQRDPARTLLCSNRLCSRSIIAAPLGDPKPPTAASRHKTRNKGSAMADSSTTAPAAAPTSPARAATPTSPKSAKSPSTASPAAGSPAAAAPPAAAAAPANTGVLEADVGDPFPILTYLDQGANVPDADCSNQT